MWKRRWGERVKWASEESRVLERHCPDIRGWYEELEVALHSYWGIDGDTGIQLQLVRLDTNEVVHQYESQWGPGTELPEAFVERYEDIRDNPELYLAEALL